jgi:hypothetical protein
MGTFERLQYGVGGAEEEICGGEIHREGMEQRDGNLQTGGAGIESEGGKEKKCSGTAGSENCIAPLWEEKGKRDKPRKKRLRREEEWERATSVGGGSTYAFSGGKLFWREMYWEGMKREEYNPTYEGVVMMVS